MNRTVLSCRMKYKNGRLAVKLTGSMIIFMVITKAVAAAATVPFSSTSIEAE